jgi:sugar/nucleoside kinase (ribokinase family)
LESEEVEGMAIRIVVAGEIFIDQVMSGFPEWPQPGEESFAVSYTREVGGGAPHTAAGLARLGWDVALAGPVGAEDGALVRNRLRELGVDDAYLLEVNNELTGTTVAVSSPEERSFFTYPGANKEMALVLESLPEASHLHLACPCSTEKLEKFCRDGNVSIDAGWRPEWLRDDATLSALRGVSWFLPNEREAAFLTGETEPEPMLRRLYALGIRAAVKLGPRGSAVIQDGSFVAVPSIPVQPLDTTGAGDSFNVGFLDAWLRGETLVEGLRKGNICGALSTRAAGGMAGFPTCKEMTDWLSK